MMAPTRLAVAALGLLWVGGAAAGAPPARGTERDQDQHQQRSLQDWSSALDVHNAARAEVGVGPMVWSDALSQSAQAWSETLAASGCQLVHSGSGENLYALWGTGADAVSSGQASLAWYNEIGSYIYQPCCGDEQQFEATGHYTQMVWSGSTELGCGSGLGTTSDGYECIVWTCHYNPAGNVLGSTPY
eukprot:TRINITY_DN2393_c0_g1_i1.p2 TRINITY_DN2393_c0_g1~~TRINITY_DN2393_c0_g1_i1.p2  ORF type:complete len:188 (-),score=12.43 TRINITY_DN2393_c0_g1_i1:267-830(-)